MGRGSLPGYDGEEGGGAGAEGHCQDMNAPDKVHNGLFPVSRSRNVPLTSALWREELQVHIGGDSSCLLNLAGRSRLPGAEFPFLILEPRFLLLYVRGHIVTHGFIQSAEAALQRHRSFQLLPVLSDGL